MPLEPAAELAMLAFAGLNAGLALLVLSGRPRLAGNWVLALLLALNAVAAGWGVVSDDPPIALQVGFVANLATLVPLVLLPLVLPRRRVGRAALAALATLAAMAMGALVAWENGLVPWPTRSPASWMAHNLFGAFSLARLAGTLLFLDAYLQARSPQQQANARLFLLAYALHAAGETGRWLFRGRLGFAPGAYEVAFDVVRVWPNVAAVAAVAIALASAHLRARRAGERRPAAGDAAVLGACAAMLAAGAAPPPLAGGISLFDAEYLLVRPVLLTAGVLLHQLVDVDARRNRFAVGAAVVGALAGVFLTGMLAGPALGGDAAASIGLGVLAMLAAAAVMARPVAALVVPGSADRRLAVYRAALESRPDAAARDPALEALRRELGLTASEHAQAVSDVQAARTAFDPGSLIAGRYRVRRRLAGGAQGEVALATDERTGRDVALKRLGPEFRRDAAALARFEKEVRLAGRLEHAGIVAVHAVEAVGADAVLVMEHLPGGTLADRIAEEGPLPEQDALALLAPVLDALAALHGAGVVHRDVKPANVLLDGRGRAKLADFGIARAGVSGETVGLTRAAAPLGTLEYMAPEQARGLAATAASDQYGAAATLYAALAGRPPVPVDGLGEFEARLRVLEARPDEPRGVSRRTAAALRRALAKDPADRFPTTAAFARALQAGPAPA